MQSGEVLPFAPTPSASRAGRTMQESSYENRVPERHLPEDAPNILIILIDDAGPGLPDTFGGEVRTDALSRVHQQGIGFNRFHTTAMCSPTRASLMTGRNHHRIGNGQIAELANDWDGYAGEIPKSSALGAEVLKDYGYSTAAWGKWHNTPAIETTPAGPFHNWPSEIGFEYFYGFLAGEASQYEPNLVRNTTSVLPPRTPEEGYHLSEDLADDAISWLHRHQAFEPDKPFFMYWATGCLHAPHHVFKEWADKYAGKFDDGWDAYRERVFMRAKERGWIPQDARLTPRDPQMPAWEDIPEEQRPFQRRLMEVAAGYAEHADAQAGRVLDELDALGLAENTLVFYIWGDNGSSGEGQNDLAAQLPQKLAQMKETFAIEAARNSVYPVGGGLWVVVLHPELRISTPYREWNFGPDIIRMPEFCAPALGNRANLVTIDADLPANASGVLYALGSSSGGLTAYLDDGYLCYEYNLFIIMRTKVRSEQRLAAGHAKIEISTEYLEVKPGGPLNVTIDVNGDRLASGTVPVSAPLLFTANDCLDIGACHGGRVSLDYYERAPFEFNGTIDNVNVRYTS